MLNNTLTTRHISLIAIFAFLLVSFLVLINYVGSEPPIESNQNTSIQYNEINKLEGASKATTEQLTIMKTSLDAALLALNATVLELQSTQSQIRHLEKSLNDVTFRLLDLENDDRRHEDLLASITKQIISFEGENAELKRILENITYTEQEILEEVQDHQATSSESQPLLSTQDAIEKCQKECPDSLPVARLSVTKRQQIQSFENTCNFTLLETELITSCSNVEEYGLTSINPTILNHLPCDDTIYNTFRFERCAVVSNSGSLLKQSNKTKIFLGKVIDAYDFVVRLNLAPTEGYEKYVGSKTSMRVMDRLAFQTYTELVKNEVENEFVNEDSVKVVKYVSNVALKSFDVDERTFNNKTFLLSKDFGLAVSTCEASLAPSFEQEIKRRGYEATPRTSSTGLVAASMMIPLCDQVHLFGFQSSPSDKLHYFGNNTATYEKYMRGVSFHNYELEHLILKSWEQDKLLLVVE